MKNNEHLPPTSQNYVMFNVTDIYFPEEFKGALELIQWTTVVEDNKLYMTSPRCWTYKTKLGRVSHRPSERKVVLY